MFPLPSEVDPNRKPSRPAIKPTAGPPGSLEKLLLLRQRHETGQELYHQGDETRAIRLTHQESSHKIKSMSGLPKRPDKSIRVLTVMQPYADLLTRFHRLKPVENRPRRTHYRGWLIIHAGKSTAMLGTHTGEPREFSAFGAIVGAIYLEECVDYYTLLLSTKHAWMREHPHCFGPFCYLARNAKFLAEPIPLKGQQGLKPLPREVLAEVCNKLGIDSRTDPIPELSESRKQLYRL